MIRRLIILLLIVGCAPTTATFYIGMSEDEFINQNNIATNKASFAIKSDNFVRIDYGMTEFLAESEKDVLYIQKLYFTKFYFQFYQDTLENVYNGWINRFMLKKEIDYEKYATPPE